MKEQMKPIVLTVMVMTGFLSSAAGEANGRFVSSNGVSMVLTVEKPTVRLGDPIRVSLQLKTDKQGWANLDSIITGPHYFAHFEITNQHGQQAAYIGPIAQWGVPFNEDHVGPSSARTLVENMDLTDQYLFEAPGRYSIRFIGDGVYPDSNATIVDVRNGELLPADRAAVALLPVVPDNWWFEKGPRTEQQVTPFGRSKVAGSEVLFCTGMHEAIVFIWLTKVEAPVDPGYNPLASDDPSITVLENPRIPRQSDYLGRTQGVRVYLAQTTNAPALWPNAIKDISRALKIVKE
jgi:hypothetical protein